MSASAASPVAETMSHWPPPPLATFFTISSNEPTYFGVILHPVALVNGAAQEVSVYPSVVSRKRSLSAAPTEANGLTPAVGGWTPGGGPPRPGVGEHALRAITTHDAT